MDVSFTFDTLSAPVNVQFAPLNGVEYLPGISANLPFQNVTVTADNSVLSSTSSVPGVAYGSVIYSVPGPFETQFGGGQAGNLSCGSAPRVTTGSLPGSDLIL
jgi:hypothetical protein